MWSKGALRGRQEKAPGSAAVVGELPVGYSRPRGEETVLTLLGAAATASTLRLRSRTGNLVVSEKCPNRGHNGLPEIV